MKPKMNSKFVRLVSLGTIGGNLFVLLGIFNHPSQIITSVISLLNIILLIRMFHQNKESSISRILEENEINQSAVEDIKNISMLLDKNSKKV